MNEVSELQALYRAVHLMMARLGADGEIDTRAPEVDAVMDAMHEYDGGQYIQWNQPPHPQPVTPAGGEVEPAAWAHDVSGDVHIITKSVKDLLTASKSIYVGHYNTPLYTHPPVADAALDTARMDWADKNLADFSRGHSTVHYVLSNQGKTSVGHTFREVIDQAMQDAALNQRGGG